MKKNNKGFTLIEIIVVIGIIAILSAIAVPIYLNITEKAKETHCVNTRTIAIKQYYVYKEMGGTINPNGLNNFDFLVDAGYILEDTSCIKGGQYNWSLDENGLMTISCSVHTGQIYLYNGTFSDINIGSMLGTWEIVNGSLYDLGRGERRIVIADTNGTDYKITANATWQEDGRGGYGLYYRSSDDANSISGYCFQFDPGLGNKFVVREVNSGRETRPIASSKMSNLMGDDFDLNAPHEIVVDVSGSTHQIYVDGIKVLDFQDDTFSSGSVGFRTWNTSEVIITDLQVEVP